MFSPSPTVSDACSTNAFPSCTLRQRGQPGCPVRKEGFAGAAAGCLPSRRSAACGMALVTITATCGSACCSAPRSIAVAPCSCCASSARVWNNRDGLQESGEQGPTDSPCPTTFLTMLCLLPSDLEIIFTVFFVCLKRGGFCAEFSS